ncbi:MAG: Rieske (2Fe-2S) protein [Candidatus Neomarinimicrobiota bacterium]
MMEKKQAVTDEKVVGTDRRSILQKLLGLGILGWLGSITYPVIRYLIPPPAGEAAVNSIQVGRIDDTWEKAFKIFPFGRKPGILFKDGTGNYRALSATCTHLSCIVQYQQEDKYIWCACHNAKFDINGNILSGPPPRPLEEFAVNIKSNGEIWVSRKEA